MERKIREFRVKDMFDLIADILKGAPSRDYPFEFVHATWNPECEGDPGRPIDGFKGYEYMYLEIRSGGTLFSTWAILEDEDPEAWLVHGGETMYVKKDGEFWRILQDKMGNNDYKSYHNLALTAVDQSWWPEHRR